MRATIDERFRNDFRRYRNNIIIYDPNHCCYYYYYYCYYCVQIDARARGIVFVIFHDDPEMSSSSSISMRSHNNITRSPASRRVKPPRRTVRGGRARRRRGSALPGYASCCGTITQYCFRVLVHVHIYMYTLLLHICLHKHTRDVCTGCAVKSRPEFNEAYASNVC